ncbi:uncharacterized protein LOC121952906 isoform X2 [Plectropomus leopardus]|uniref:uncharacterized protein LOC121952906 isoform X2 n=1 Tax=Plectropomus leopardus TaxID=160734 RepID=UPI001C4CA7E0|nr:uncharacterized protein LOC121952906 isoform X2 [Plectropomus leopardus]
MGPRKYRVSRDTGLLNKEDTPVKPALSRRGKYRRLLPTKHYEAFSEEPEVDETNVLSVKPTNIVLKSIKPAHFKSVSHLSNPASSENKSKAVLSAMQADKKSGHQLSPPSHPTTQMTPKPEAFKGGKMPDKGQEQNLTLTLESISSSSMESDTTFSLGGDGDEEDCDFVSTTSSSLPSPEIYRRESSETFSRKEELLDLHVHIKNSTLLDVSHAQTIDMHNPPNLSNIINTSTIPPEKNCDIKRTNRGAEAGTKIHTDSSKSEEVFKWKTPSKLTNRRPILFKKKVWFKSPIAAQTSEAKHTPATKFTIHNTSEPVHMPSLTEQTNPTADTSRKTEINSKEELRLVVTLRRPVKSSPEKPKFFDFIDDSDREAFFKRMRERCVELRNVPLFPLTAPENTD